MSDTKRKAEETTMPDKKMKAEETDAASSAHGSPAAAAAKTVEEVLKEKATDSKNTGVFKLETMAVYTRRDNNNEEVTYKAPAFFMKTKDIRFRHEGESKKSPNLVYLEAAQSAQSAEDLQYKSAPGHDEVVAVYYSASGSGKTVELAASSVTRRAHLALLVTLDTDISLQQITDNLVSLGKQYSEYDRNWKGERNKLAFLKLRDEIDYLVEQHWDSFFGILKAQPEDGLKLVIGIDEASSCPIVVRSIISNQDGAARAIRECLCGMIVKRQTTKDNSAANSLVKNVKFLFSVAGTGASSSTIGSLDDHFQHLTPSVVQVRYLYPRMDLMEGDEVRLRLPGKAGSSHITIDAIKQHLPILYCMMENARMASIALLALRQLNESEDATIVEKGIVDRVCELFIESNGLFETQRNPDMKNAVGACAFAMMLFQRGTPVFQGVTAEKDTDRYYLEFKCGFEFDKAVTSVFRAPDQCLARKKLVAKYGLLEPNRKQKKGKGKGDIETPFIMRPSQQLICLSLLGVELSQLVRADPFGFEVLSTHTMKAALAASSVVAWKDRESVKKTLERVGCMFDQNATQRDVEEVWNELDEFFVVRHDLKPDDDRKDDGMPTRLLNVELEVGSVNLKQNAAVEGGAANNVPAPQKESAAASVHASSNDGGIKQKKVLYIECAYQKDLSDALPPPAASQDLPRHPYAKATEELPFYPPITAINYGNSWLPDGFITCFVAKKEWLISEQVSEGVVETGWQWDPVKFTAMNQAKDKLGYSGNSKGSLKVAQLRDHAERCSDPVMNGLFGEKRLLFVSAPQASTVKVKRRVEVKRPWLPRAMDECTILCSLMSTLSRQRTQQDRKEKYTVCVDKNGDVIEVDDNDTETGEGRT